jgi:hypothetical protein
MPGYRLFLMEADGQASEFVAFMCDDDAQARAVAEKRRNRRSAELWRGHRLIAKLREDQDA